MTQRITTPFGFASTAAEVVEDVDLTGRRALVTGGAAGIGIETARALAGAGAEVVLAVRRPAAGEQAAADITASTGNSGVTVRELDLADQDSVRRFVAGWDQPLHILVNNAGIMALPELERSPQGWEMQFATNFVGHLALTVGLHDAMAAARGARVVSVASTGHLFCPVVFDDLHYLFRPYDPLTAYAQSKTANVLLAVAATRRWADDGIYANALNPGAIATGLQKHTGGLRTPPERRKTPQQGAATSVLLAASPLLDGVGGRYFDDCAEAPVVTERPADHRGVADYALDPGNADRLWDVALKLVG
ncbi:SDR family NAD(P)-dependent oxidoreductase [Micromonospora humi]|uniref:Probable oxidoreductase n=1 Tax=Micromonospora humi TaxID=745366 RepID=A0A1C5K3Q4_9ACTN|nr:SDR family NAD(P)-dependent oxidoreductase [Micromonospora humi]SCG77432.1 NAD(P)-dependent dehydrogenase, short-chain alcohol dehydrogenase family [Micromonospora humi]